MTLREIVNRIEVLIRAILDEVLAGYVKVTDVFTGKHSDLTDVVNNRTHEQIDAILDDLVNNPDITAHAVTHAIGGDDELTPAMIGAADIDHTHDWEDIEGDPSTNIELNNYVTDIVNAQLPTDTETRRLTGTVVWKTGLTYITSDLYYKILGSKYSAYNRREITLEDADANLPRIDVIYCDTFSNVGVLTGIPSNDPVKPLVSSQQLELTIALVAAGATEPSNVTIVKIYDENTGDPDEWDATQNADSGITIDLESTIDPQNGTKNIKIDIAIPDSTVPLGQRYVGEQYQGGVIFYIDSTGKKGLIVAPSDISAGAVYQSGALANNTQNNIGIGFGEPNTAIMMGIAQSNQAGMAAYLCTHYINNDYDGWFLGSRAEMMLLWKYRDLVGGFTASRYWTSTEALNNSSTQANFVNFTNGSYGSAAKGNLYRVRPIRAFDDTVIVPSQPVTDYSPADTNILFTGASAIDTTNGVLTFWLKTSKEWLSGTGLYLELYNGTTRVGSKVMSDITKMFNFNTWDSTYQMVAIPLSEFSPLMYQADKVRISLVRNWNNNTTLQIDNVRLQYGTMEQPVEPIATDNGIRTDRVTVSAAGTHTVTFRKPMGTLEYEVENAIKVVQSGADIGYTEVTNKTLNGFDITIDTPETGDIDIIYTSSLKK